jgi:hypothetical protein
MTRERTRRFSGGQRGASPPSVKMLRLDLAREGILIQEEEHRSDIIDVLADI